MMARVERNTETGTQTQCGKGRRGFETLGGRTMEQLMEPRSKLVRNNLPEKTTIVLELRKTKDVEEEPTRRRSKHRQME